MTARLVGRLSIAFLLDFVEIRRGDLPLIDGLIVMAVEQANMALVAREPELRRTYGGLDTPPPEEARRPAGLSAVADALRLPHEAVRRRIPHLAAQGLCTVTPRGVLVTAQTLASAGHRAAAEATYERLRGLYWRLRDLGVLRDFARAAPPDEGAARTWAVLWLPCDLFLRVMDAATDTVGDLTSALVLLAILRANTEQLPDTEQGGDETQDFVADQLRQPVSAAALAARLGLPEETVRKHAQRLIKEGRCERRHGGLIIPAEFLARPTWVTLMAETFRHLHRMFAELAQMGVLAAWDEAQPRPQADLEPS